MKVNQLYEAIDLSNTSIDDEEKPNDAYSLMGFDAITIDDESPVTLMKDAKIVMSDTWGNIKEYLSDNRKDLFGAYSVVHNGETIYTTELAG